MQLPHRENLLLGPRSSWLKQVAKVVRFQYWGINPCKVQCNWDQSLLSTYLWIEGDLVHFHALAGEGCWI